MKKEENRFPFSMYYLSGDDKLIKARTNESSMEIIEIISGTVKMQVGTEGLYAEAGDFVYVPPGLVLSVNAEVEGTAVRGMIFDASIIEENMENFDTEVFYMFH